MTWRCVAIPMTTSFQFPVAAQRLRPQHGSISHPQKIPSKYWVLKIRDRNNKKCNYPRSRIYWSPIVAPIKRLLIS